MGQILSCIVISTTWCFCTATSSLLSACCGNDKASNIAPGVHSGRKRSVLLMILTMIISFVFQYWIASLVVDTSTTTASSTNSGIPTTTSELSDAATSIAKEQTTNFFREGWLDGCTNYTDTTLQERCVGNSGVYRATSAATLFFLLAAIAVKCKPSANREAWPAKYILFILLCGVTVFIPNQPLFSNIYMNIARIGGVVFILFQSIVFVDMAYNINDSFVEKSNAAEAEETGSGQKYLLFILFICAALFLGSITVIGLMYYFFDGCTINTVFITVTLLLCILVPLAQLTGEEGSLLSSAITCAYATYLCFSALSRNPNEICNPKLGEEDFTGILLGVGLTMVSLGWTGWSYTASKTMHEEEEEEDAEIVNVSSSSNNNDNKDAERKVTGVVTGTSSYGTTEDGGAETANNNKNTNITPTETDDSNNNNNKGFANSWKLNLVLALISCWFAMAVTSWGSIETGGDRANPEVGKVSMWMLIASQWVFMTLYIWTLTAPRLFPDRDFS